MKNAIFLCALWKNRPFLAGTRSCKLILLLLMVWFGLGLNGIFANQPTFLSVNLPHSRSGMFSVFNYVVGALLEYEKNQYSGIEVNFENSGLYFEPEHGLNWWNYYCEPICLGTMENSQTKTLNIHDYNYLACFTENRLSRQKVFEIIQNYIKIREPIQKKIDRFVRENFVGHYIISVHYRGTDKHLEAIRVPFEQIFNFITNHVAQNKLENYRIFVATDEQKFIDAIEKFFPNLVFSYPTERSIDGKPLHYKLKNNYLKGEDALIDCILLSHGDYLIRTSSNLSLWSTYFNPSMPVLEINPRKTQ